VGHVNQEQLTVKQTATGYWVVKRGSVELAGALTRQAAEAERELMRRLSDRSSQASTVVRRRRRSVGHPSR
jgi:hypothetical protein